MLDLLSLTVILPLLGAIGISLFSGLLSGVEKKRVYLRVLLGLLPITVVVLASLVVFAGGGGRVAFSSLDTSVLVESFIELRWDSSLWPLGLGLSISLGCLILATGAGGAGALHPAVAILSLLGFGLASLWSGNPLTTLVCWSLYDLALALGWVAVGGDRQEAVRVLAVGMCSGLLLWAGLVAGRGGVGSVAWGLLPPGGPKMILWMGAGLVRIGAYPLHTWVPRDPPSTSASTAALLLSPLLGWGLWIRLASVGDGNLPVTRWMIVPALLTLLMGGILAWTENEVRRSRGWISMTGNGTILFAAMLGQLRGTEGDALVLASSGGMMIAVLGWTLNTTVLFLGGGIDVREGIDRDRWPWAVPSLVGTLSLIGVPFTVGFPGIASAFAGAAGSRAWVLVVGGLLGHLLLSASTVRWFLTSGSAGKKHAGLFGRIAYGAGLGGIAVALVVCGLVPGRLAAGDGLSAGLKLDALLGRFPLTGWLRWGGAVLVGGIVAWLDHRFRPRVSLWLDAVHDVVLLEWGYGLIVGAVERGMGLVRVVDEILGGRAAVLWSSVFLLIVVLMMGR